MPTFFRRLPILLAFAAGCAPLFAQEAPVDLKKWPKGQPEEQILLKDEKAVYKRLTTDEDRRRFIEFFFARRSTAQHNFRMLLNQTVDTLKKQFEVKHKDSSTGKETVVFRGWETDPGRMALLLGLPDSAEESKTKDATYVFHYKRKMTATQSPAEYEFKRIDQPYMGDAITILRYNSSFPPSVWTTLLAPADADWESYKADPTSVLLKECVPLIPMLCAPQAAPAPAPAADGSVAEPAAMKMAAGALPDPDFSLTHPDTGSLGLGVNLNFLPTQNPGDTEIRIVLAVAGEAFTGKAHLIPEEGTGAPEQNFVEADFKSVTIKGNNYLEARRSVKAGRYLLAAVAVRGAEFGRKAQTITVPNFEIGRLTIATSLVGDRAEQAKVGDPLTIGDLRILPRTTKFKTGELVSIYAVVNGGTGGPAYKFEGEVACHVEFAVPANSKHKIDFGKSGVQESICLKVTSGSPLIGFEDIKVPPPPQPSVRVGADLVPIRTKLFRVKYKILDVKGGQVVESAWITIDIE